MTSLRVIVSSVLTLGLAAAPAVAQTTGTTTPTTTTTGTTTPTTSTTTTTSSVSGTTTTTTSTYDNLSIGNRKIARALFEAQKTETPTTTTGTTGTGTSGTGTTTTGTTGTGTTTTASKNLTLDQIAALKQSGQGWGQVFKQMQARGLVTEKNLGQVISQYNHKHAATTGGEMTTAGNRTTDSGDVRSAHDGTDRGPGGKSSNVDGAKVQGNSGHGSANSGAGSMSSGRSGGSNGGGHGRSK